MNFGLVQLIAIKKQAHILQDYTVVDWASFCREVYFYFMVSVQFLQNLALLKVIFGFALVSCENLFDKHQEIEDILW